MSETRDPIAVTRRWVEEFVAGLGLCPFAAPVLESLRIVATPATELGGLLRAFEAELSLLLESDVSTTLLVTPEMLADFEDYLDAFTVLEAGLAEAGLEGVFQVASFHPDYRFADVEADDVSNFSNRSPYPLFHLIRETDITAAIESHPDPEGIPRRNVERLRELGRRGLPFWGFGAPPER